MSELEDYHRRILEQGDEDPPESVLPESVLPMGISGEDLNAIDKKEMTDQEEIMSRMQHAVNKANTVKDLPPGTDERYVWGDDEPIDDFMTAAYEFLEHVGKEDDKTKIREKLREHYPVPEKYSNGGSTHLHKEGNVGLFKEMSSDIKKKREQLAKEASLITRPQPKFEYKEAGEHARSMIYEAMKRGDFDEQSHYKIAQECFDAKLGNYLTPRIDKYKNDSLHIKALEITQKALMRVQPLRILGSIIESARSIRDAAEEEVEETLGDEEARE